jgi:RimJ/RimL family protein N-acetyltransferase
MLEYISVRLETMYPYIEAAFRGDAKLCSEYHISCGDTSSCSAHTHNRILDFINSTKGVLTYAILDKWKEVGFVVLHKQLGILYSFGLNIAHRNTENKEQLLKFVSDSLNGEVKTYLYDRNKPAINFLLKNGYEIQGEMMDNNDKVIILNLKQCQ